MKTLEFFEISKLQDPDRIKDVKGGNTGGSYSGVTTSYTTGSGCADDPDSTWLCNTHYGNGSTACP